MPVQWLKHEAILWGLLIISALSFITLLLLAWHYRTIWIAVVAVAGYIAPIAFMVYGNKDLD